MFLHCEIRYPLYSVTKFPLHVFLDRFNCNLNYNICMVYNSSSSFPFLHLLPPSSPLSLHLRLLVHTKINACSKRLTSDRDNVYSAISYLHSRCLFYAISKAVITAMWKEGMGRGLQIYL